MTCRNRPDSTTCGLMNALTTSAVHASAAAPMANDCFPSGIRLGALVGVAAMASAVARETAVEPTPRDHSRLVAVVATAAPVLHAEMLMPVTTKRNDVSNWKPNKAKSVTAHAGAAN